MAGSNTYGNYRHQADAFHAYQIAKRNGIPESNIILLAFDDIAKNKENPFPGKVFNKPTAAGTPGVDVYDGVKISYSGKDVTAANFLKVLSGDTSAPGPVLKSTASDNVFVYYADHGGTGILGVPTGNSGGYIHAADINKALETLQAKGGYKDLLFYLEACESGSIFKDLLKAPNAKAVTAANPKESSWGWYCAGSSTGGDMVDGKNIGSCLGDEFSVRWMEDTDAANIGSETVGQQDKKMITAVTKSHVQIYGTTSFDQEAIGDFVGNDGLMLSSCSGSADPVAATCYEGAAGALGVKETVKVNLKKYASGAGSMDLAENVGQLKRLNTATFPVTYQESFYADLMKGLSYCKLGFYADVLVGSVCCRLEGREEGGRSMYIMTLSVLPAYQRRGFANQLITWAVEKAESQEAQADDVRDIYLHVQTSNEGALSFYKANGFEISGEIKNYYDGIEPPDCYILRRAVGGSVATKDA